MLEGSDRTVDIGEGGLEMCADMRRRSLPGMRWQFGRRAPPRQCRADPALALVESFPDALPGPGTSMAVGVNRSGEGAGHGAFEEPPQTAGGDAQSSDFVSAPDTESAPATAACIAVAAKDPPPANRFSLGAVVVAAQIAVPNEHADNLAVRARRLFEPLGNGVPFVRAAVKPSHLAHARTTPPRKAPILAAPSGAG